MAGIIRIKNLYHLLRKKPVECDFYDNGTKVIVSLHNDGSVVIYDINEKLGNITELTKKVRIIYNEGQEKITNLPAVRVGKTPKIISVTYTFPHCLDKI